MAIDTDQLKLDMETSMSNELNAYTTDLGLGVTIDYTKFVKTLTPAIMLAVQALIDDDYPPVP